MSTASNRAYKLIRDQILTGKLPAGSQIKEEEIAARCGVSRTPVRDALRRLEAEMFIRRTDTQRSYVFQWTREDIEDVYMLRSMLEAHAASLAATRATTEVMEAINLLNEDMARAVRQEKPDVEAFLDVNSQYHAQIIKGAASERLGAILNRLILLPLMARTARRFTREHLERSLADHFEIAAAISCRDPEWAGALMTAHVRRALHVFVDDYGVGETAGVDPHSRDM